MVLSSRPVEGPGGCENPKVGKAPDRGPAVLPGAPPQIEPGLGTIDHQPEALQGRGQQGAARGIPLALGIDVVDIGERGDQGPLDRTN